AELCVALKYPFVSLAPSKTQFAACTAPPFWVMSALRKVQFFGDRTTVPCRKAPSKSHPSGESRHVPPSCAPRNFTLTSRTPSRLTPLSFALLRSAPLSSTRVGPPTA